MSKKIKLGDYNRLRIVKKVDFGLYLDGGDEGEILLPSRYVPEDAGIGDELDVFIYLDQEERLIATTETPLAKVGDFAYLEVKWVNEYGAFLGWGLMKDIFCPFREQKKRMVLGNSYIVHIHIDEESYRIVASAKIERYLNASAAGISKRTICCTGCFLGYFGDKIMSKCWNLLHIFFCITDCTVFTLLTSFSAGSFFIYYIIF